LFDAERKKPLPFLPEVIGVVTSPTGAVIRDILHRLNDRFPRHVLVWPVRVQGETAAAEVVAAVNGFNAMPNKPDLLIIARGGGSLEDLWPFNDEAIVRAVAASSIPVISAIGHETDTTLIDHAADWRAPTPTAAAERAVPVRADLLSEMASISARQKRAMTRVLQERKLSLQSAARALPKPDDILAFARQRFDTAVARLPGALSANVQRHNVAFARLSGRLSVRALRERLSQQARKVLDLADRSRRGLQQLQARRRDRFLAETKLLQSMSYRSVLARGFAVVRDGAGKTLQSVSAVSPGSSLRIQFHDGDVEAVAQHKTGGKGSQGSLF
jgi:exodeoxyribonuclease VII large subunit